MNQILDVTPVRHSAHGGELPLSLSQAQLWFLDQLEPGNPAYNLAFAYRINGRLDLATLERSLNEIVRRHESLRMIFPSVDGKPVVVILPTLSLALKVLVLRGVPRSQMEDSARSQMIEEVKIAFDLSRGPLVRACLIECSGEDKFVLVTMHSIVSDDLSLKIFACELGQIYRALAAGKECPLPGISSRYLDFSRVERQPPDSQERIERVAHWTRHKAGSPPSLRFRGDFPQSSKKTYLGASHRTWLSRDLSSRLTALSQQEQVSPFIMFLAAFTILLNRYTEENDIVVGSPVQGRERPEFEHIIGRFAQSLPLRINLSGNPSFRDLLSRVRRIVNGALTNRMLPELELTQELEREQAVSCQPFFQVEFLLGCVNEAPVNWSELHWKLFDFDAGMVKNELTLEITEQSNELCCHLRYSRELFEASTIARMAGHFLTLLESIASDPAQCISSLSILSDAERRHILKEWAEVKTENRERAFSHELFEAQAEQTPNSVAVTFQNEKVSYRELDQRANQLARYLQNLGVGPEVRVGICLERSIGLVTSVLAILKAGGACLPLDPGLPGDRLNFMLTTARCPIVLTEEKHTGMITNLPGYKVFLDKSRDLFNQYETTPPANTLTEGNLAHIFFTSGSTGDPKGVMWNHRKQPRQLSWVRKTLSLSESDRHLMKSPIGLTPMNTEIFWPLLSGAQLIIAPSGIEQDTAALVKLMAEQKITVTTFVPSLLRVVLDEPGLKDCVSLRKVVCFGEELSSELERLFYDRLSADLCVIYGATEAPSATFRECRRGVSFKTVNLGRRIPGKQILILDTYRQLVPVGVTGEIYLGGESLARGYLDRPDLTEERFVPNPYSEGPGTRIYRTGDRGRYLPDGSLEFLGRADFQIKIRGFRVEPGEIEAVLEKHASVHKALVVAREDGLKETRLVAYVVPKKQQTLNPRLLRGFLKQALPTHLIPSAFVFLDKLPLTASGKLNRNALPEPDWAGRDAESAYVAPKTPMEELLTRIWSELLNLRRVGIRDDFFDLGGHSLLATQLMSRVRNTLSVDLPLRVLFENPTVESLAVAIVESLAAGLSPDEIPQLF